MSRRLRRVKSLGSRLVSQQIGPSEELVGFLAKLEHLSHSDLVAAQHHFTGAEMPLPAEVSNIIVI